MTECNQRKLYEALVENSEDGIYVFTEDGQVEFVNQRVVDVSCIPRNDWTGANISVLADLGILTDAEIAAVQEGIETIIHGEEGEVRITLRPDVPHELRDLELRLTRLRSGDGADAVIGFSRDVTEQREYQRELEKYKILVETVGDPMYILNTDGTIEMANEAMLEYLDADESRVVGTNVSEFMVEEDFERGTELIKELIADPSRDTGTFEMTAVTPPGEHIPAETNVGVLLSDEGGYRGSVGVVRNIAERKEHERELQRQNERLDEFASIVSHDLRNPLNVATSRLELAKDDCDSEHLEAAERALDRMNTLIDDLLALARGGDKLGEVEQVDLGVLIEDCWQNVDTEAATLVSNVDKIIQADRSRLQQLLENLIRNAVEHGGDGVRISVGDLDDGFYVEDDGPGISKEAYEDVFQAGYSTTEDGTGFGLSIVKQVVDAHDWEIRVTEGSSGGARFEITVL